jgi:DNA polymerase-3 subunit alpha
MGEVGQSLINGNFNEAKKTVEWYLDVFGEDYYLEMQRHEYDKWIGKVTDEGVKSSILEMKDSEDVWNKGII